MTTLLRSVLSVSAATVLSRATGYLRWSAQAAALGAGAVVVEAYSLAILLPSLIYELFIGSILYSIFIPVLVDRMTHHGEDDARGLTNALFILVLPLMGLLAVLGIVFAGPLVDLVGSWDRTEELSAEQPRQAEGYAVFSRIFALQMLFYGLSTIATGVLQAHRRFFLSTFAPVLNNLIIIGSFAAFHFLQNSDRRPALYVLALGVTVGAAVMALALVPMLLALGYRPRPQVGHPALLPTAKLAGPMGPRRLQRRPPLRQPHRGHDLRRRGSGPPLRGLGNDHIVGRDLDSGGIGQRDVLDCGLGHDTVVADFEDRILDNCEEGSVSASKEVAGS